MRSRLTQRWGNVAAVGAASEVDRWARIRDTLATLGRTSSGTTLTPYYDTGDAYRAMWKAVDEAERRIVWQTFIFDDDVVGKTTFRKLMTACERGVQVEFLYDAGGTFNGGTLTGRRRLKAELVKAGAKVIEYRPFHRHVLKYFANGMHWRSSPGLRNHRKVLVVDDRIAFIGGLNVGDNYAAKSVGGNGSFRDTMCCIEGAEAVAHVNEVCVDTVENQEGSKTHPSLQQRWRQWARRVAPVRIRAQLFATPRLRRAKAALRRQVEAQRLARLRFRRATQQYLRVGRLKVAARLGRQRTHPTELPTTQHEAAPVKLRSKVVGALRAVTASAIAKRDVLVRRAIDRVSRAALVKRRPVDTHAPPPPATTPSMEPAQAEEALDDTPVSLCRPSQVASAQVLMCNPHTQDWSLQRALWIVSREAQSRLWVTTPYFLPNGMLFRAVLRAAKNGVDVRIVAGSYNTTDPWFMWYTSQYVRHKLLNAGVKLYEFEGGQIMHAKTAVVDGRWACIGSYNWDVLSNKLLEASVAAYDVKFARTMEEHFLKDLSLSREVTQDDYAKRSLWMRALCAFFYYGVWLVEKFTFYDYSDRDLNSPMGRNVEP